MSIGANIRRLRESHKLTQEDFGKIAHVSAMAVSQWENNRAVPRMGAVQALADHFGVSKGEIIDDTPTSMSLPDGAMPVYSSGEATVPLTTLGRVHAGDPMDEEEAALRVEVPASVLEGHPRAFALVVEGDCMSRVVQHGDHVLVDPDMLPGNGSIVVAETEGYRAIMRRWYRGSSTLMLVADSYAEYEDLVFTAEDGPVRVLGVVFWHQAPGEME